MRKLTLTIILSLVVFLSFGQKHDFLFQVMPQWGKLSRQGVNTGRDFYDVSYNPRLTVALGVQSKSRLFYQVFIGTQSATVFINNEVVDTLGPPLGTRTIQPSLGVSLGYNLTTKDKILAQSYLWSYALSYQRDLRYVSLGISAGRMFTGLSDKLRIGPSRISYMRVPFIYRNILISAFLNFNLSSIKRDNNDGSNTHNPSKGAPKEF